jgi:hypothetical protein
MAELKVEKKSNFPWWIWLIIALIIIVLLIVFMGDNDGTETRPNNDMNDTTGISEVLQTAPERSGLDLYGSTVFFREATLQSIAAPGKDDQIIT